MKREKDIIPNGTRDAGFELNGLNATYDVSILCGQEGL